MASRPPDEAGPQGRQLELRDVGDGRGSVTPITLSTRGQESSSSTIRRIASSALPADLEADQAAGEVGQGLAVAAALVAAVGRRPPASRASAGAQGIPSRRRSWCSRQRPRARGAAGRRQRRCKFAHVGGHGGGEPSPAADVAAPRGTGEAPDPLAPCPVSASAGEDYPESVITRRAGRAPRSPGSGRGAAARGRCCPAPRAAG